MALFSKPMLPLLAVALLSAGGCNEIQKLTGSGHYNNGYYAQDNTSYSQPLYGQGGYAAPAPAYDPTYNNRYNYQQANVQPPATGHWEWGKAPDGRRTRLWIPDNSYKLPAEAYGGSSAPQPWAPPLNNQSYASAYGRYDTLRYPDGRLEHEWRGDEPASPAQGYWQLIQGPGGFQRTWIPGVVNTASDR